MTNTETIDRTIVFVKETLKHAEGGHDWFHTQRVLLCAEEIARGERLNSLVVSLGALLHDIADAKFHEGDETVGSKMAHQFLTSIDVDDQIIDHVIMIIENISFKTSLEKGKNPLNKIQLS